MRQIWIDSGFLSTYNLIGAIRTQGHKTLINISELDIMRLDWDKIPYQEEINSEIQHHLENPNDI